MKKIVYKTETGIAVITPTHGIAGAMKDIPKGAEYKIVDELELPQDRTYRNAWTYDFKIDPVKKTEIDAKRVETEEQAAIPALVKHLVEQVAALEKGI